MDFFTHDFHPSNKNGLAITAKPLFRMVHSEGFEPSTARFVAEHIQLIFQRLSLLFFHPLLAVKPLFCVALFLIFTQVYAPKCHADSLYIGAATYHFNRNPTYDRNENNKLIAYQKNKYVVGYFLNSYYQDTVFLQREVASFELYRINISATAGGVYGYHGCDFKNYGDLSVCPYGSIEISIVNAGIQPVLLIGPRSVSISTKWTF